MSRPQLNDADRQVLRVFWSHCAYCRAPLGHNWQADHITSLAAGGTHRAENLCAACSTCNASKGAVRGGARVREHAARVAGLVRDSWEDPAGVARRILVGRGLAEVVKGAR